MGNHHWLALFTTCSLVACGGSTRTAADRGANARGGTDTPANEISAAGVHLGPGSWNVTATLSSQPAVPFLCGDDVHFSLTVDADTMTFGVDGGLLTAPVQIIDGAYVATAVNLRIGNCSNNVIVGPLTAQELRLKGIDSDGDGEADRLEATATLPAVDVVTDGAFGTTANVIPSIVLSAVPDHTAPTLFNAVGSRINQSPLGGVSVSASEPLDPATALTLTGTSSVALHALDDDSPAPRAAIQFGTSQVLPFGGSWQLSGVGRDLAGNALQLDGAFLLGTWADPGVQAQDGFEAPLSGVIGAQRIASFGSIPALSGAQSLWLGPDSGELTVHLQRSANQKNLHFVARAFDYVAKDVYTEKLVRAGVVGGSQTVTLTRTTPGDNPISASGDGSMPWVSALMHFDATLNDAGEDVVLGIVDTGCVEGPGCALQTSWMIDDLTID